MSDEDFKIGDLFVWTATIPVAASGNYRSYKVGEQVVGLLVKITDPGVFGEITLDYMSDCRRYHIKWLDSLGTLVYSREELDHFYATNIKKVS